MKQVIEWVHVRYISHKNEVLHQVAVLFLYQKYIVAKRVKMAILWAAKKIMHVVYVVSVSMPFLGKRSEITVTKPFFEKTVANFYFRYGTRILILSDDHFGSGISNPLRIRRIVEKSRPDVIVIAGDLFDPINPAENFFEQLSDDEKDALAFLKKFSQQDSKTLILLKGDHDWWLTDVNPLGVIVHEKVIIHIDGEPVLLVTHGDEYDIGKKENGTLVSTVYHWLRYDRARNPQGIGAELLSWGAQTSEFVRIISGVKRLAINDAIHYGCKRVCMGHFHFMHKYFRFVPRTKRKRVLFVMSEGGEVGPFQYIIQTKKRLWIRSLHGKKRKTG